MYVSSTYLEKENHTFQAPNYIFKYAIQLDAFYHSSLISTAQPINCHNGKWAWVYFKWFQTSSNKNPLDFLIHVVSCMDWLYNSAVAVKLYVHSSICTVNGWRLIREHCIPNKVTVRCRILGEHVTANWIKICISTHIANKASFLLQCSEIIVLAILLAWMVQLQISN